MAKGQKTGGRTAGTPNKTTAEIREAARLHAADALAELARIMKASDSDTARIAACREILDRAYGKAPQAMTGEGGQGPQMLEISWRESKSLLEDFIRDAIGESEAAAS
jgi:hypothetical protein